MALGLIVQFRLKALWLGHFLDGCVVLGSGLQALVCPRGFVWQRAFGIRAFLNAADKAAQRARVSRGCPLLRLGTWEGETDLCFTVSRLSRKHAQTDASPGVPKLRESKLALSLP